MRVNYAILFVSDMERSLIFYRDVLGMPVHFTSPGWTEFVTEGATLALHLGDAASAAVGNTGISQGRPSHECRPS